MRPPSGRFVPFGIVEVDVVAPAHAADRAAGEPVVADPQPLVGRDPHALGPVNQFRSTKVSSAGELHAERVAGEPESVDPGVRAGQGECAAGDDGPVLAGGLTTIGSRAVPARASVRFPV